MSPRADPACIIEARRAAIRNGLIGDGASDTTADAWIVAWVAEAARDGLERDGAYWDVGWAWIAEQRERQAELNGSRRERG